jgi:hypothetical protein
MLRLATLLTLTSLLVVSGNTPPASAQERPQERVQQTAFGETSASSPAGAESPSAQETKQAATPQPLPLGKETRYLAFQIFTSSPDPTIAESGEGLKPLGSLPEPGPLRDYIKDIRTRIGTVGDPHTRLAVIFGPLSFDHTDAEVTRFIHSAFYLALETEVAVGFHIDDSMFWAKRKDLWSDPKNVEALDWEGTPCTGRRLDWSKDPSAAPPQMCFNSKVIQQEVQRRATLIGKAIQAGVKQLQQHNRPELFAGVIAGSETMIGQDFNTNKYLGYRALLNRGFTRAHPPQDMDLEREKVVQEFIEHWTEGIAAAGVSPQKIYSHTAFFPHRAFNLGDNNISFSQFNHFAPPSVAFGKDHRPGFSTYPQPGLFDEIYTELVKHKQVGWASSEGTNLQLGSGPGQSGMNMETYLAKMFNHGAALVTIFSWGIGGEANKNMSFRVVTEGEEALRAYNKFLKGEPLIEADTEALTLMERLPIKIHKIQKELPAWIQKTGNREKATALMQELQKQMDARNFEAVEKAADAILEMMGLSVQTPTQETPQSQEIPEEARKKLVHELGHSFIVFREPVQAELKLTGEQKAKLDQRLRELLPDAMQFFQQLDGLKHEEEEKASAAYFPKALAKLAPALKEILTERQRVRLQQMVMQREGLFGGGETLDILHVTQEQRKQFVAVVQQTQQQKIQPLLEEAQKGGNPAEVQHKVLKMRRDLEASLEALLTEAQKKQWKEMLGKPVDQSLLFELSYH